MVAYTLAGNMQDALAISPKEVILALLLGQLLAWVVLSFRHSAPYYIGIFGTRMGSKTLICSSLLRILFTVLIFYGVYLLG